MVPGEDDDRWTADRPAPGVVIWQPARGFRYSAEAFWLAGFALEGGVPATALDLGTGSGILALLLARRGVRVTGVDVQAAWAPGWARTLRDSTVAGDVTLRLADVATLELPPVDLVVSNPPFFPAGSGPVPADPFKRGARFEQGATVADFVRVACAHLALGGRACLVVPREREGDVLEAAPAGFSPARTVRVGRRRVLVELARGVGAPQVGSVAEEDPRVRGWYELAAGPLPIGSPVCSPGDP